ncbi:hypothetical protein P4H67_13320 [Paenibacillus lautus]|uniref:hypothetical protein n=1 Tax=Paenibacillus lautus TaxID=1401 RepID=UPI002DBB141F|nr:hypothetical protein [Paenibacillus lautus]MEC0307727.1 hypothetical protein [Paenibacillus lautus]
MQYLNVLLEPLDDENQAYFYGERLRIDYVLLTAIQREAEEVNKKLSEEIYRLMNNIVGSLHINLFIVKVNWTKPSLHLWMFAGTKGKFDVLQKKD